MPNDTRDDESGRFAEQFAREDFLDALADHDGMAGTTDVAEAVGASRPTAYLKLEDLADEGAVEKQKVGGSILWRLTDPAAAEPAAGGTGAEGGGGTGGPAPERDAAEPDPETGTAATDTAEDRAHRAGYSDENDGWPPDSDLDAQIEALELTGSADSEEGRAAIRAIYEYLRENGSAGKQDFLADVYPDYSLGIGEDGWWNGVGIRHEGEGFKVLAERRSDLRPPAGGDNREYEYLGDGEGDVSD